MHHVYSPSHLISDADAIVNLVEKVTPIINSSSKYLDPKYSYLPKTIVREYPDDDKKSWRIWLTSEQKRKYLKAKVVHLPSVTHSEFVELMLMIDQGLFESNLQKYKYVGTWDQQSNRNIEAEKENISSHVQTEQQVLLTEINDIAYVQSHPN
jgi:hypothetical protein